MGERESRAFRKLASFSRAESGWRERSPILFSAGSERAAGREERPGFCGRAGATRFNKVARLIVKLFYRVWMPRKERGAIGRAPDFRRGYERMLRRKVPASPLGAPL